VIDDEGLSSSRLGDLLTGLSLPLLLSLGVCVQYSHDFRGGALPRLSFPAPDFPLQFFAVLFPVRTTQPHII